jgi:hypothetical protein
MITQPAPFLPDNCSHSTVAAQVAQLASGLQVLEADPTSEAAPQPEDLRRCFDQLQEELVATHGERERDLLDALDAVQERQVALRTHFKALCLGYRQLRYQVEDAVAQGGSTLPIKVVHESNLLGEAPGNILANDEVSGLPTVPPCIRSQRVGHQALDNTGSVLVLSHSPMNEPQVLVAKGRQWPIGLGGAD